MSITTARTLGQDARSRDLRDGLSRAPPDELNLIGFVPLALPHANIPAATPVDSMTTSHASSRQHKSARHWEHATETTTQWASQEAQG